MSRPAHRQVHMHDEAAPPCAAYSPLGDADDKDGDIAVVRQQSAVVRR